LEAEKKFRRIKGYQEILLLKESRPWPSGIRIVHGGVAVIRDGRPA
jgi:hypothetical protein